ncbi:L,D-transpeptidase family protein [Roseisalinus antarcticus]|uniref:L,D-transpeptidase catalytic domain n=1 Tax=Roseisalinus antarcticus TaxID=254357 RepID=A0A1Y5S534_9RHOB|nr:L,D-transpeptidase family protein [Roseisalinus antarcticus]SLN32737.1 L,D-transpeptidase catalytic domain [Roseisalinus antarcticus]
MRGGRILILFVVLMGLASCSTKFRTYNGPAVTQVILYKEQRALFLMHNDEVLEAYNFELGFAPAGHKIFEGDGRTPEGYYTIDRRNPNSDYHLSIGISYPDAEDIARAEELGLDPGGEIFIHGTPKLFARRDDWTAGCIAVTNREIEQIYAMVRDGTPIAIYP